MSAIAAPADPPAPPPAASRIVAIDVLRGLAILWVVVFHLFGDSSDLVYQPQHYYNNLWSGGIAGVPKSLALITLRNGYEGVPIFMMLSGLSLYLSTARRGTSFNVLAFYRARFRRLLVPYWAGFALFMAGFVSVAALQAWTLGHTFTFAFQHDVKLGALPFTVSWTGAAVSLTVVPRLFRDSWLPIYPRALWFVALIIQYYLLFPYLLRLMKAIGPARFLAGALVLELAAKALIIAWFGALAGPHATRLTIAFAFARPLEFALGMTLGYVIVERPDLMRICIRTPLIAASFLLCGLTVQNIGSFIDDRYGYAFIFGAPLVIGGFTAACLPLIAKPAGRVETTAAVRALASTGVISYAVLIVSEPVLLLVAFVKAQNVADTWWWFVLLICLPVCVLIARPFAQLTGLVPRQLARPLAATPSTSSTIAEPLAGG